MDCLISLGSNLGDRRAAIEGAAARLAADPRIERVRLSPMHETQPVGGPGGQGPFLNAVARLDTTLGPEELLRRLLDIEAAVGRRRAERWGPRPLDLDLLLHGQTIVETPDLCVPHPRMAWRRFVLEPAAEVGAEMTHPTTGWTVGRLREHLDTTPYYLALTGSIGVGKTSLAERVVGATGGRLIREPLDLGELARFYADPPSRAWDVELGFLAAREALLRAGTDANSRPVVGWAERSESHHEAGSGGTRCARPTLRSQAASPAASRSPLVVSDFWFDQSAAFARVWLDRRRCAEYDEQFAAARERVARPRLVVLLRASAEQLRRRVQRRGREGEQELPSERLAQIAEEIEREAARPDVGPVLRLDNGASDADAVLTEVLAAAEAMR